MTFRLRNYQEECLTFTDLALKNHERVANVLPTGAGKGHPVDTDVPTPSGWRQWGDLKVGDQVFGRDGSPTTVTAVYDRGALPAYRVTFSDGTFVEVDGDHLWLLKDETRRRTSKEWGVHETRAVMATDLKPGRGYRWHIPVANAAEYEKAELPLDPYVVGALTANGGMTGVGTILTTPDEDVAARVALATRCNKVNVDEKWCDRYSLPGLTQVTKLLGMRVKSGQKRVPQQYLTAGFEQRLALLQGLMDGDGSARDAGRRSVQYHTTSAGLADDVVELVNSLGGTARIKVSDRSHHGKPTEYQVSILLPSGISPFGTSRKGFAGTETRRNLQPKRAIVSIEPVGVKPIRCITVDAPDSLYLITRSYIVTHNTVIFAHLAQQHLAAADGRVLILVHTDELVQQAYDKVRMVNLGTEVGIVKAQQDDVDAKIIVASVQTLRQKARRDRISGVTLIIVDECHHLILGNTYSQIIGHYESARVVGFTATLGRSDDADLSKVWQHVAYRRDILWMIRNEYLIDVKGLHVKVDDLDLKKVKKSRGDFQDAALGQALSDSMAPEVVARALREYGPDRQTICFTPLVSSAYEFADAFSDAGFKAEVVHGALPKHERRAILRRYAEGVTQVLCNAMVLCLDDETEILTSSGWVGIDGMTLEHEVANWDQGKVFFAKPLEVVVRDRDPQEEMYVLETPRRSVRVTGGHRMLYRTLKGGKWKKEAVQDLAGRSVKLPTTGWAEPQYRSSLSLDECRLIGFWMGDGSVNRPSRGGLEYTLSQSLRYPKIIHWVDELLERVGIDFVRYDKSHYKVPHVRWSLPRGTGGKSQARRGVFYLEEFLNKDGSSRLWDLDHDQFDALLEGLWYADGDHGLAEAGRPSSFRIYAKRLEMLERLQAIASVRGWTSSLRKESPPRAEHHAQVYRLGFTRKVQHAMGTRGPQDRIRLERAPWKSERVWCVKNDTRNIITRRRGSVTVMGNTEGFDAPATSCIIVARPTKSKPLFQQMVGRGLRVDPEKPWADQDCLVMIVAGAEMHDLRSIVDLTEKEIRPKPGQTLLEAEDEADSESAGAREKKPQWRGATKVKEFDPLMRASRRTWSHTADGVRFLAAGDHYIVLLESAGTIGAWDVCWMSRQGGKLARQGRTEYTGLPLDLAMDWGEDVADRMGGESGSILNTKGKAWRRTPISDAQRKYASRLGIEIKPDWRKGDLAEAIDAATASRRIDPPVRQYRAFLEEGDRK